MRMIRPTQTALLTGILYWGGFLSLLRAGEAPGGTPYVTWPPIEPDKAIAAWLIKEYVNPQAQFVFLERGTAVSNGISFDIPGSEFARDPRRCTSESIIQAYGITNGMAVELAGLARRFEIAYWCASFSENENALINEIGDISTAETNHIVGLTQAIEAISLWVQKRNPELNTTARQTP